MSSDEFEYGNDNSSSYDTYYYTKAAIIIPSVTGSISAISSLVILSVIIRSEIKLSSTYHRIMFFMSFWDVVGSTAVALTTLPMPRDVVYPFAGPSFGTEVSCQIQGFVIFISNFFVYCTGIALNIYYLFKIRYAVTEKKCKNCLEPILLLAVCTFTLVPSFIFMTEGLYNPTPFSPFCSLGPYPWDRDTSLSPYKTIKVVIISGTVLGLTIVVVTMVLIIEYVYKSEQVAEATKTIQRTSAIARSRSIELTEAGLRHQESQAGRRNEARTITWARNVGGIAQQEQVQEQDNRRNQDQGEEEGGVSVSVSGGRAAAAANPAIVQPNATPANAHVNENENAASSPTRRRARYVNNLQTMKHTKIIMFQAMLYLGAFFLANIFFFLTFIIEETWYLQMLRLVFTPLQGFFNAIIFIYHKAYNLMRANDELNIRRAIFLSVKSPKRVPDILVSDVVVVAENDFMADRQRIMRNYFDPAELRSNFDASSEIVLGAGDQDDDDHSFSSTSPKMLVELGEEMSEELVENYCRDAVSSCAGSGNAGGGGSGRDTSSAENRDRSVSSSQHYNSSLSLDQDLDLMSLNPIEEEMD